MERLQSRELVENYELLASVYDDLLQDPEAYGLWLEYIKRFTKGKRVLELASGSAIMAKILQDDGYEVIASDISKSMQEAAKRNYDGPYMLIDMTDIKLDERFDLVLCICDSMNYMVDEDMLKRAIKCAYDVLDKGGVYIFDMHDVKRLEEFKEMYIEEGIVDDIAYQWTIQSDAIDMTINEHFAFYLQDKVVEEAHTQRVYPKDTVIRILKDIGFKVTCIDDFIKDEKVLFIGEKI